ncbi:MAG TPA: hypothetical protein PK294_06905 [Ignavibacteria bacterium]|nr:hypothetical protein [Ignavibacteria bacterium]HQY52396.1 hypothetical protein [Ignavibacteria bacterium]HRB00148.1 hypothetical protein [Ignavibacteria bacterium]
MNGAHLHLILNHIPVIGTIFAMFILFIGIIKKSDDVKKVCMLVIIFTSILTIPVYLTGDKAEEMIEGNYEDVDEEFIHSHEDFALYSFIAMNIMGAVALISMFIYKKPKLLPNSFAYFMFALLIIVNGMMTYTANLGGKIHHPEIREDKLPWESNVIQDEKNDDRSGKNEHKEKEDELEEEQNDHKGHDHN